MSTLLHKIALSMISSVGPISARQIVSYCGGPEAVFRESRKNLLKIPGIGPKTVEEILHPKVFQKAEKELLYIEKQKVKTLFYLDKDYPSRLKEFTDSPVVLYFHGNCSLNPRRSIGIVGSRNPTESGIRICEKIIHELKDYDVSIISGLAYGIDGISHRKALALDIPTIGVMGNGIDITYPAVHRSLRKKMLNNGGILTEFPSGTTPEKEHFPMRNRIIAGLSDALLVVESGRKGGSMISAHIAFSYNKDVFAIPGRVDDKMSRGPNFLIKSNVAALAENAEDIAYKMLWEKDQTSYAKQLQLFEELEGNELKIVQLIRSETSKSIELDKLHYNSKLTTSQLSGILLDLECRGIIKSLPGSRYRVC